jgi:hypothetical protein
MEGSARRFDAVVRTVGTIDVILRGAALCRRIGVKNLLVDPLGYLTHDGVHPGDIVRDNLRAWLTLPLSVERLHDLAALLKGGIVNFDRYGGTLKGGVKCGCVIHRVTMPEVASASQPTELEAI